jgi:ferric-dicitrate binding protein FerR (iron transport regulator)
MAELPAAVSVAWAARLEGGLDEQGARELGAWLDRHPDELAALRRDAALDLALAYALGPPDTRLRDAVGARLRDGAEPGTGRFAARVMTRLRRRPRAARSAPWSWVAAAATAAALAAMVVLAAHGAARPEPEAPEVPSPPSATRTPVQPDAVATVTLQRGVGGIDGSALATGRATTLAEGGEVTAAAGSVAELRARDGSLLTLEDDSQLSSVRGGGWRLERGALTVEAAPQAPGHRLSIATPHGEVTVIGTRFRVEADTQRTWVRVDRGHVALAAGTARRELAPGEEALSDAGGVGAPVDPTRRHVLLAADGEVAAGFDPLDFGPAPGTYHDLPLARFVFQPTPHPPAGFADVGWKLTPGPGERHAEVWFRAEQVAPMPGSPTTVVALMAALDSADYILAEREVAPDDHGWIRIAGEIEHGRLNWTRTQPAPPLTREAIRGISFRAYRGHITGVMTLPVLLP